jgi:hypothetical protein
VSRPRCLQCGGPIPKQFERWGVSPAKANGRQNGEVDARKRSIFFDKDAPGAPATKEDCQRFTNATVQRVDGYLAGRVSCFSAWDGESYADPHFCKNKCAERFGRRAAASGVRL